MKAFIFSIGAAVMVATAGPAFAADLPSFKSAPVYAPPPPAFTWTGFYLDAGAGYGEWNANTTTRYAGTGICELCTNQIQGGHGFLGRAGAGFDYQFADQFVAGVFGDGTYSEMRGSLQDQTPGWTANTNQNWSWAAGGRLGWLMTPELLLYGDAGFSQARFTGGSLLNADGSGTGNSTQGFTANGWFAGGGFETMFAPGWFWRTEYRFADYGGHNVIDDGYAGRGDDIHFHPYVQTVTSSLVYKFGWPGFSAPGIPSFTQITDGFGPAPAATNWTGVYADAGIGYGLWSANTTTRDPVTNACDQCVNQRQGGSGIFGTVGLGYDYQVTNKLVAGVFGDFDPSQLKGTIQDGGPYYVGTISQNWAWNAGARLGWLVTPQVLTYTKAGFTQARFGGTGMQDTHDGADTSFSTSGFTTDGWMLAGGVEAEFAPGWFWRAEYRYAQYGVHTIADTSPTAPAADNIRFHPEEQTATVGVVYKFNWAPPVPPAPVVAKY